MMTIHIWFDLLANRLIYCGCLYLTLNLQSSVQRKDTLGPKQREVFLWDEPKMALRFCMGCFGYCPENAGNSEQSRWQRGNPQTSFKWDVYHRLLQSLMPHPDNVIRNVSELRLCEFGSGLPGIEKWYAIRQRRLPRP